MVYKWKPTRKWHKWIYRFPGIPLSFRGGNCVMTSWRTAWQGSTGIAVPENINSLSPNERSCWSWLGCISPPQVAAPTPIRKSVQGRGEGKGNLLLTPGHKWKKEAKEGEMIESCKMCPWVTEKVSPPRQKVGFKLWCLHYLQTLSTEINFIFYSFFHHWYDNIKIKKSLSQFVS